MKVGTIGLDLAKDIFQVHGADAEGQAKIGKVIVALCLPFHTKTLTSEQTAFLSDRAHLRSRRNSRSRRFVRGD